MPEGIGYGNDINIKKVKKEGGKTAFQVRFHPMQKGDKYIEPVEIIYDEIENAVSDIKGFLRTPKMIVRKKMGMSTTMPHMKET